MAPLTPFLVYQLNLVCFSRLLSSFPTRQLSLYQHNQNNLVPLLKNCCVPSDATCRCLSLPCCPMHGEAPFLTPHTQWVSGGQMQGCVCVRPRQSQHPRSANDSHGKETQSIPSQDFAAWIRTSTPNGGNKRRGHILKTTVPCKGDPEGSSPFPLALSSRMPVTQLQRNTLLN